METPEREMPENESSALRINDKLEIREDELRFRFSRSSGPGGQHVNRSETRVELLFDVANSPGLSDAQRAVILHRLGRQVDTDGVLHIVSSVTRSQAENRADAIARFQALLAAALRPRKRRVPTRPSQAARAARLTDKKVRSTVKASRRSVREADE
jgi:ribosome-associated protein